MYNGRVFARVERKKYNETDPLDVDGRYEMLKELLGTCSKDVYIEPPFYFDYGSNIHLEENVYMNFNCFLLDGAEIRIGARTKLGPSNFSAFYFKLL